jgi:GT2 family glycosyltransferase
MATLKKRTRTARKPAVLIAVPVPIKTREINDLLSGFCEAAAFRHIAVRESTHGRVPETVRNTIIHDFLNQPEYKRFTHLMFLDADTVPVNPYAIEKLLSHNKDVVAGITPIYWKQSQHFTWNVKCMFEGGLVRHLELEEMPTKPFTCLAVGGTTILLRRRVLEKLSPPYQKTIWNDDITAFTQGEDFYFCDQIRQAGFDIWVDPDVVCRHFHTLDILDLCELMLKIKNKTQH